MSTSKAAAGVDAARAAKIASLNDKLRTTGSGGSVTITRNLRKATGFNANVLRSALASYNGFDAGNDPYSERDFGMLTLWGHDLIWKIDYCDKALTNGSEDPADPTVTHRVLTVMLATDW